MVLAACKPLSPLRYRLRWRAIAVLLNVRHHQQTPRGCSALLLLRFCCPTHLAVQTTRWPAACCAVTFFCGCSGHAPAALYRTATARRFARRRWCAFCSCCAYCARRRPPGLGCAKRDGTACLPAGPPLPKRTALLHRLTYSFCAPAAVRTSACGAGRVRAARTRVRDLAIPIPLILLRRRRGPLWFCAFFCWRCGFHAALARLWQRA